MRHKWIVSILALAVVTSTIVLGFQRRSAAVSRTASEVLVANSATNPVMVQPVTATGAKPYYDVEAPIEIKGTAPVCTTWTNFQNVVLRDISVRAEVPPGQKMLVEYAGHYIPLTSQGTFQLSQAPGGAPAPFDVLVGHEHVSLKLESAFKLPICYQRSSANGAAFVRVSTTGCVITLSPLSAFGYSCP